MNLAKTAIERPIWVAVSVVLIFVLGLLSIRGLPIQLFPDIDRPHLNISVSWRSASPQEMESEVTDPIEQEMQGVQGLKSIGSNSYPGFTEINMAFALGTDMQRAQLDVISRLNRVSGLPDNIGGPYVNNYSSNDTLTFFFIQQLPGAKGEIDDHQALIEARVKPELERIPGVSTVDIEGINERQIQIRFDPYRAAELGVEIPVLASRATTGWDVSAGTLDIGRWEYKLRFAGRYDVAALGDKVVDWRDGLPIYLRDVAEIRVAREENPVLRIQNGNTAIAAQIFKESGANALAALRQHIDLEHSRHTPVYQQTLSRLEKVVPGNRFTLPPEACMPPLLHALNARCARPRYQVTTPSKWMNLLRGWLPTRLLDALDDVLAQLTGP